MMIRRLPMVRRTPFLMETGISQLVDDFFRDFRDVGLDIAPSFGRTDIYEKDKQLVFETELPGMRKDEVEIRVEDGKLLVSGEMRRDEKVDEENYFRVGRSYGRFQRVYPLPMDHIEPARIGAKLEDGILRVMVPLKTSIKEKEKAIEVKVD